MQNRSQAYTLMKILACLLIGLFLIFLYVQSNVQVKKKVGDVTLGVPDIGPSDARPPLAPLIVYDQTGNPVLVSEQRGIVQYLNFWAEWCEPCLSELPKLTELQKELSGKLQISLINLDTEVQAVQKARDFQLKVSPELWTLYNEKEKLNEIMNTSGVPYHIILDKNGGVAATFAGSIIGQEEKLKSLILLLADE